MKSFVISNDFDLNDIVLLLSLSSNGSMSATARSLGLDVSTVSRRISGAEKALGVRLFIRSGSRYEPTDAGLKFVEQAERIYDQINTMLLTSTDEAASTIGSVRITSTEFLFDYWLVDYLPELKLAHPGLQLQLIASDRNLSFTRREADFALRLFRPSADAALTMRKFGDLGFAVYATADFAQVPRSEWAEQPWIGYDESLSHTPEMQWLDRLGPNTRKHLRVNTLGTMVRACLAGNGMALLPCLLGSQVGLLKLSERPETTREVWLLSHRDAGSIARFKIVSEWLKKTYTASQERFSGLQAGES